MDNDHPPTAPGFHSLPIAPESASVPLRSAWSLRRRAAMAVAALALVGTGGAVAGSLNGQQGTGAGVVTPTPAHTAPAGHEQQQIRQSGEHESDEA